MPVALLLPPPGSRPTPYRRRGLSRHAACQLLTWYTAAGDLVADLDQQPAVTFAAGWLERRLTTGDRSASAGPGGGGKPSTEQARLVIATLPRAGARRLHSITDWISLARARLLADDGYLLTIVTPGAAGGRFADHATIVVTAARAAGLAYHQHLIDIPHPLQPEHETRAEPAAPATGPPPLHHGRHRPAHAEIYVFAAAGGHRA